MDRQPILQGEVVTLRPLRRDDWDALLAVASDPQIWALHPAHDRWQEAVFRPFFDDALAKGGALAIIARASGDLIGSSRFQGYDPAAGGSVEIGWTFLARSHWGSGANRDLKRLMVGHALQWVRRVYFAVGADNIVSRKALDNIGASLTDFRETRSMGGRDHLHLRYEIDRAAFANGPLAD